jgi:hypothetical protein
MPRAEQLAGRLPELYRDGETLSRLLAVWGNQLQMAHFFHHCVSLEEAAKLAALLDIPPEPWQGLTEYRAWVEGLRSARLRAGAVTCEGIRIFTQLYLAGFERAHRIEVAPAITEFAATANDETAALVENPPVYRYAAGPSAEGLVPLQQFALDNRGIDPAPLALVITAFGSTGPEFAPLIANLTTGEALVFLGKIPPGQRLWLLPEKTEAGSRTRALLEGAEVSDKLRFIAALEPGVADSATPAASGALTLARGHNDFWFLPLAHYDVPGLDRALLALADLSMTQGRWDETSFDRSLFAQTVAARLQAAWREAKPAAFELQLPAGALRCDPGALDDALAARETLEDALREALRRLSSAGVEAGVSLRPKRTVQPMGERLAAVSPWTERERGPSGADRLPDLGGRYGITELDESTFD